MIGTVILEWAEPLKRRSLLSLGLGSLAVAVGGRYFSASKGANLSEVVFRKAGAPDATLAQMGSLDLPPNIGDKLFEFAAVGDVGTGKKGQYAVAEAMTQRWRSSPFPLTLLTGDNIYESGEIGRVRAAFERPYATLLENGVEFYAALGNHDFRTNRGEDEIAYPGYNMLSRYYTFTEQSVQFFALDTNLAIAKGGRTADWQKQLQWLKRELARSPAPWKIVFAHHPVYSSGYHGSEPTLIASLTPLFAEYGVQLYINGHDHNYERTEPIEGTTYITSGNGAKLRPVDRSDWTAYAVSKLGFNTFEVYADWIVVKAIDSDNVVYDVAAIAANQVPVLSTL